VSVHCTSGDTLTQAVEHGYDYADRRIAKRVDDIADATWDDEERFVYDGEDLTMVYDETGTSPSSWSDSRRLLLIVLQHPSQPRAADDRIRSRRIAVPLLPFPRQR